MIKIFTKHPHKAGETYLQHFCFAAKAGLRFVLAGIACTIHGLFPFLFEFTGSNTIETLSAEMIERRSKVQNNNRID